MFNIFSKKKSDTEIKATVYESVLDESLNSDNITIDDIVPEVQNVDTPSALPDMSYLMYSHEVLGWASAEEQIGLANIVTSYITPQQSILDVGCGRGDMFNILLSRIPTELLVVNYTGIDVNPNIIEIGKRKYPDARLEASDIFLYQTDKTYDWVVASGTFNYRHTTDTHEYLLRAIDKMFSLCNIGVAFNVLTEYYDENDEALKAQLYKHDTVKILQDVLKKYPHVILRTDYMVGDSTFYILKKS